MKQGHTWLRCEMREGMCKLLSCDESCSSYALISGGGIAVGSCLLVDEDRFNTYTSLVMKYYIAEGVTNNHKLFIASANQPPADILQVVNDQTLDFTGVERF